MRTGKAITSLMVTVTRAWIYNGACECSDEIFIHGQTDWFVQLVVPGCQDQLHLLLHPRYCFQILSNKLSKWKPGQKTKTMSFRIMKRKKIEVLDHRTMLTRLLCQGSSKEECDNWLIVLVYSCCLTKY